MVVLGVIKLPDHAQAAQSASSVGHWSFSLQHAFGEVADLVLRLLSDLLVTLPENEYFCCAIVPAG